MSVLLFPVVTLWDCRSSDAPVTRVAFGFDAN